MRCTKGIGENAHKKKGGKKKLVPNFSTKKKGFTKKSSTLQYVSPINWKPKSALHSNHHT